MQVLRLAKRALETCACRHMGPELQLQGSDGCYRCIRSYHLQYRADRISREWGITLLGQLIEAGERREPQRELESIKPNTLFGSMLEKKFVDALQAFVQEHNGTWEPTLIRGNQGFRFALPGADRLWELELQPRLGQAQGVAVPSQPDFLLRCDEDRIKPMACANRARPVRLFALDLARCLRCHPGTLRSIAATTDRPLIRCVWCPLTLAAQETAHHTSPRSSIVPMPTGCCQLAIKLLNRSIFLSTVSFYAQRDQLCF